VETATHTITTLSPQDTPEVILRELGTQRSSRWLMDREPYRPQVTVLDSADGKSAALTSGRPNTQYTKVVDLWASTDAAGEKLLDHLIETSKARGDAGMKWEVLHGDSLPAFAASRGFKQLHSPIASAAGTEGTDGFALWHQSWPHPQLAYYGQTTEFTCGPVAAMTTMGALGLNPFGAEGAPAARERELRFWRLATNFPACEPIGLAVAMHDALEPVTDAGVEVYLDTDGPILIETYKGEDRAYRELLQSESRLAASTREIAVRNSHVEVAEILTRVSAGDYALLLIDEVIMHAASVPHWVVAHAVQGDTVLLHDPWVTADKGETWVDSHDLPVSAEVLDQLVAYGEPSYRGVIFVSR